MDHLDLHVSADKRRLLGGDGTPVLLQGDAAWSLIANLSEEDARAYLEDRQAKGFNTLIVNLIEYRFAADAPRNRYGEEPFLTPGDFSTPNEAYMARAERVLAYAAELGIRTVLAPAYLGYPDAARPGSGVRPEGWYDEFLANGEGVCFAWGAYVGRRFGHIPGLIWMIGGDRNPERADGALLATMHGITSTETTALFTAHVLPESSVFDVFSETDWIDIAPTYTYHLVHTKLRSDYERTPTRPGYLQESTYEGEHNASALQIRRQAYWAVLAGSNGHYFGNNPIWLFAEGWKDALDWPGSVAMERWGAYFRAFRWYDLKPDFRSEVLIAGEGEHRGLDSALAARTGDGAMVVVYTPAQRPLTIAAGQLAGKLAAVEWFDPATGTTIDGGLVGTGRDLTVTPPFASDAVLKLTAIEE